VIVTGFSLGSGNVNADFATVKYCAGVSPANDNFNGRIVLSGSAITTITDMVGFARLF